MPVLSEAHGLDLPAGRSVIDSLKRMVPDANIVGHVVEKGTGNHVPFATISVKGTNISVMTDYTGHFFIKNMPAGTFSVSASAMGYSSAETSVKIDESKITELNFELLQSAIDIDEIVVSATRNETDRKKTSTIVNVVSGKLFNSVSSNTLSESVCFQPGVRVENSCANCGAVQMRINGLEGQYTQMLLDSKPIFSSLAGVYGLEQMPVSMIERVEVIRGGGSALFGSNAIGGVVNIITKEPLRNSLSISNNLNVLKSGKKDNNLSFNGSYVSDDHKTGVYLFGMLRNREAYDRNGDGFSDIPELKSQTAGFRGYHKLSPYSRLTAEYHHITEYRRGGDSLELQPHETDIAEQTRHYIDGGSLTYDFHSPDQKHLFSIHGALQNIDRESYYGVKKNPDAYGRTNDLSINVGTQYTYRIERLFWSPSDFTVGLEYSGNNLHDKFLGYGRDMKQNTCIWGGYFQNEWKSDRLNFLVGARIDKHNLMNNAVVSPRVNLRYSPAEWIGLRASYSSGFRAPQAFNEDLHIDAVGSTVSVIRMQKDLKPEYSHSISASADLYHSFGKLQVNLLLEGFYTRLENMFDLVNTEKYDEFGNLVYERVNANGARVAGLNAEIMMGIPKVFSVQMGYTFQKSRYLEDFEWVSDLPAQRNMFRTPDNYAYLTSEFFLWKNLKLSVFGNYTGSMLVQHASTGPGVKNSQVWTESFIDIGSRISYEFRLSPSCRMELNGGVKNIFDEYQKDLDFGASKDAGYIYGPTFPRLFFAGIRFSI